jgi:DNA-binding IclR family transcriptional regulator
MEYRLQVDEEIEGSQVALRTPGESAPIAVLVKAFRVLEVMAERGEAAPLRDIARTSNLPKGTLFRILQTLNALGYVGQISDSGFYHLTSQMSYLGRNARHEDIKMLTLPNMRRLLERFNETVNLGILEGEHVYYVAVLEAQRALSWRVPTGTRDFYYSTALGRAIVAHMPDAQREAILSHTTLRSRTARTVISRQNLVAILNDVCERGTSIEHEENDDGVVCIGVPVFLDSRVVAAVSISIPASRHTAALETEVRQALLEMNFHYATNRDGGRSR